MAERIAIVIGDDADTVAQYLPDNYRVAKAVVIVGDDSAGWTMEDYVLPRLASGLHIGYEVTAEHQTALGYSLAKEEQ